MGIFSLDLTKPICVESEGNDPEFLKQNLKLLFSSNGEQEGWCEASRAQIAKLNEQGVTQAVFYSTPGYHDLTVCRKSIRQFLPRLFR